MIQLYYKDRNNTDICDISVLNNDISNLIWIDLVNPSLIEIETIEQKFSINIPTRLQQEEIELSSRYIENDEYITIHSIFLKTPGTNSYETIHVSFILKDKLLITYREEILQSFIECTRKINTNSKAFNTRISILLAILETRVDMDADLIEAISEDVSHISNQLNAQNGVHKDTLIKTSRYQEIAMKLRESIIDKHRVISSILKSDTFNNKDKERFKIILEDINSLTQYTDFLFERLEYLQNTFFGLINIDQNNIIKIFTIISVVFMPPTLIASIYGMNYKHMPELEWPLGYAFALIIIFFSAAITLYIFKKRKWI